ncbi:putative copper resistance protein D [Faunimonas pinastri]|uniref:Putative copper resistance protein D n=1 Tax=Faunimonas pinastri TaxID=1855383 RepID=A0A1H9C6N1_9HYPH|nr:copper homeostasis membrane protein CopD [Faunimonas pinastri]SEP96789.1 putative copper resistance protein D [Faunimonas pinastri]
MITPGAALTGCRFLHDAFAMLVWGSAFFVAALVPRSLRVDTARSLRLVCGIAVAIILITALAALPIQAAGLGDGWTDALRGEILRAVVTRTSAGSAWVLQAASALLLCAALAAQPGLRPAAIAAAAAIVLGGLTASGHAAMHGGWLGVAHRANDAIHLLSGGFWFGALIPLFPVLRALDRPEAQHAAAVALRRFSSLGHLAVALVVLTGAVSTALVLGRLPTDLKSPYQALLLGKISLVTVMSGLAIVNRYVVVPRMASDRRDALAALRTGIRAEILLGFVVIGLVAAFGMMDPA